MTNSKEQLRSLFQSQFSMTDWQNLLKDLFGVPRRCDPYSDDLELDPTTGEGYKLGSFQTSDHYEVGCYYYRLNGSVDRRRVSLRNLVSKHLKIDSDAALAVFDGGDHWRFSFVCDLRGDSTSPKRFSYVLGDSNNHYRTPVDRMTELQRKGITFSNIKEAFSVDALSNEFFDKYRDHYADIVEYLTGKRMVKVDNKWVEKVTHAPLKSVYDQLTKYEEPDKVVRDYVKKMMGRIVFLHFLQKKGWLNDDINFMQNTFANSKAYRDDYLEKVLEPLFFGMLNTKPEEREKIFAANHWDLSLLSRWNGEPRPIPYLNGGLFERDAVDELNIKLPASLFEDLFRFLASYNFTVDENDPDDAEVGVDPEMLGKIFESLLEDNKSKGAFYTPKEIVRYMCKESLIAYLSSKICESQSERKEQKESNNSKGDKNNSDSSFSSDCDKYIRAFVETHEMQPELEPYRDTLDQALRNVKICDPAIGSGAFPMGLLNELWRCREALYSPSPAGRNPVNLINSSDCVGKDNGRVSNTANGGNNLQDLQDFASAASRRNEYSRSQLKKEIIENNIYGVDIERGAIDIARLRFWLSIVVDAEEPEPLPNFDYKFMQGNSLIESFDGFDLSRIAGRPVGRPSTSAQLTLGLDTHTNQRNLHRLIKNYFRVTDHQEKAHLRRQINDEVKLLIINSLGTDSRTQSLLDKLDVSANQDFFLWHTWFKDIFDSGGFDIVIGNPPYIQLQADGGKLGELYKNSGFYTFTRTGDIYSLFYEQGWNILAKKGHLCFITSNKWMRAGYGEKTREFFTTKTNPTLLVDLGANVFENATVDTNILLYSKASNQGETLSVTFTEDSLEYMSDFVQQQGTRCHFAGNDSWVILSAIEQSIKRKIEAVGTPLREWDINIYRGVLTGYNEAFIVDTAKRDEILGNCKTEDERKRTAELIRPILRGRDIKRYGYDWANLWLINTHNGVRGRIPRIDIEDYPTVKQHLDKYWDKISSRADKGDTPYNLRNCAYLDDFSKPKIIYPETTQGAYFAYDDKGLFIDKTCFMLISNDGEYLQQTLSSKLFEFAYKRIFSSVSLGEHGYQYNKHALVKLPIIKPEDGQHIDTSDINHCIYNLYNISPEEISYIEQG